MDSRLVSNDIDMMTYAMRTGLGIGKIFAMVEENTRHGALTVIFKEKTISNHYLTALFTPIILEIM